MNLLTFFAFVVVVSLGLSQSRTQQESFRTEIDVEVEYNQSDITTNALSQVSLVLKNLDIIDDDQLIEEERLDISEIEEDEETEEDVVDDVDRIDSLPVRLPDQTRQPIRNPVSDNSGPDNDEPEQDKAVDSENNEGQRKIGRAHV